MNAGPESASPQHQPRPDVLKFHPVRAAFGASIGLFIALVLCAATEHWIWLLLAPVAALLLAFDFWWRMLGVLSESLPDDYPDHP